MVAAARFPGAAAGTVALAAALCQCLQEPCFGLDEVCTLWHGGQHDSRAGLVLTVIIVIITLVTPVPTAWVNVWKRERVMSTHVGAHTGTSS
jgi:hypothetical protein